MVITTAIVAERDHIVWPLEPEALVHPVMSRCSGSIARVANLWQSRPRQSNRLLATQKRGPTARGCYTRRYSAGCARSSADRAPAS
jgi:hypothetical protein